MRRALHRVVRADDGFTIVELAVAMLLTAMVASMMIVWILGVADADDRNRSNGLALGDLRDVSDQIGRDIRSATSMSVAQEGMITVWIDGDLDDVLDPGETVTWQLTSGGAVTRAAGGDTTVVATRLDRSASSFSYDAADPADVAVVSIELVALSASGDGFDRLRVSTDVYLRRS